MGIPAPLGVSGPGLPAAGDQANAVVSGQFTAIGPGIPFAFRGQFNVAIWASVNTTLTTTLASAAATVASATGLAVGASINGANIPKGSTIKTLSGTDVGLGLPTYSYQAYASAGSPVLTGLDTNVGLLNATVTGPGVPAGTTVYSLGADGTSVILTNPVSTAPAILQRQFFKFALAAASVVAGADAAALFTGVGVTFSATVELERSFDGGSTWLLDNTKVDGTVASFNAGTNVNLRVSESEKNVLYRLNCVAYTSGTINYRLSQTGGAAESLSI